MTEFDLQLDNFMLYCDAKHLSKKTLKSYEQTLTLFRNYLVQELNIEDAVKVKPAHIRKYIQYLRERGKYTVTAFDKSLDINYPNRRDDYQKPMSDTTIANYTRNMRVFFNFLLKEREIKESPMENVDKIKPKRKKKQLLKEDELKLLFNSFNLTKFHEYRTWIQLRLILDTGLRATECCMLMPEDIDFKTKAILIKNAKYGHERYVFFSHKMSIDLKRWVQHHDRYTDSPYLFPTSRGTQLNVTNFESTVRRKGREVGLQVHPHLLRNNFAKYYLLNDGDFATLSRLMGHSSVEVTQKAYLDFNDKEIGRKYQKHSPLNNLDI
ncbi:tyrosine-type recombinase/integrase [Metasolibacillus meyeri]|uniref:tyrosine-type recombinase/integrase n=1 Tax=Metasolibacillus meyeri TaxID=1071052 RepID=UPI000D3281E5|nr:tyrosine-type recombinase/integrase [Metasolibacillus meyeri]